MTCWCGWRHRRIFSYVASIEEATSESADVAYRVEVVPKLPYIADAHTARSGDGDALSWMRVKTRRYSSSGLITPNTAIRLGTFPHADKRYMVFDFTFFNFGNCIGLLQRPKPCHVRGSCPRRLGRSGNNLGRHPDNAQRGWPSPYPPAFYCRGVISRHYLGGYSFATISEVVRISAPVRAIPGGGW